jgi:hypothetical protein
MDLPKAANFSQEKDPFIDKIRASASRTDELDNIYTEIKQYYNDQILIAAANVGNWDAIYKFIQSLQSKDIIDKFIMLLEKSNIYSVIKKSKVIVNTDVVLINLIIALLHNKNYIKVKELLSFDINLNPVINYLINQEKLADADFILKNSRHVDIDQLYTSNVYYHFKDLNAKQIEFIVSRLKDTSITTIFFELINNVTMGPVLNILIRRLSSKDLLRLIDSLIENGGGYDYKNKLIDFILKSNLVSKEDKIRLIDGVFRYSSGGWQKIIKFIYFSMPLPTGNSVEINEYPTLHRYPPSYDIVYTKLREWAESKGKLNWELTNRDIVEFLNFLDAETKTELEQQYRIGGIKANETLIDLYRKQGLIEEAKLGPNYLIPDLLKPNTLNELIDETNLALVLSPASRKLIQYINNKKVYPTQLMDKFLMGDQEEEMHVWIGLTGLYIFEFSFSVETGKVKFLLKPGSLLIVPQYEELNILMLTEGKIMALI